MKKRMRTGAAGMAAAALLLTGCGGAGVAGVAGGEGGEEETSATAVYDEINALSGQERTDRLVELAQEEGELTIYHSNTDLGAVIEAFEETYDMGPAPGARPWARALASILARVALFWSDV